MTGDLAQTKQEVNQPWEYVLISVDDICCPQMKEALHDKAVFWGEADSLMNRDTNANIATCRPYPEGAVWTEYAINCCPFCATPIKTTQIETTWLKEVVTPKRKLHRGYEESNAPPI